MQHLRKELQRQSRQLQKITPTERKLLHELIEHIHAGIKLMVELGEVTRARRHLGLRQVLVKSTVRKAKPRARKRAS